MIPVKTDNATFERYVTNIITRYGQASVEQKIAGERWYTTANELANILADGDTRQGAGVIAALSANKSWRENTQLATRAYGGRLGGHTADNLRKASKIMAGQDPADVLPMDAKTGNFFLCIADPQHPTAVCIDRHAHDVAVGEVYGNRERGLSAKGRYYALADAYREAARRLHTLPLIVQAVVWVVHIESLSGKGTRGIKNGNA